MTLVALAVSRCFLGLYEPRHEIGHAVAAFATTLCVLMFGPPIVHPIQLQMEGSPKCRALRHESDVLVKGLECRVEIDGRWRLGVITRVEYSTVHVELTR